MSNSGDKLFDRMGTVVGVFGAAYALWFVVAVGSLVGGWQDKLGVFGDSFGVINALFSGGAIMFVAFTIWQQQKLIEQGQEQLKVQEQELKQNTEALLAQKSEMEAQNRYLDRQVRQNQFFQLLNAWRKFVEEVPASSSKSAGQDSLNQFVYAIHRRLKNDVEIARVKKTLSGALDEALNTEHYYYYARRYFSMLYEVMRYVDYEPESKNGEHDSKVIPVLSDDDKCAFMRIIRSQMSDNELLILICYMHTQYNDHLMSMVFSYKLYGERDLPSWIPGNIKAYLMKYGKEDGRGG